MPTMMSIDDAAAHVLTSCGNLPAMKLHCLLFYCQAWSLALDDKILFEDDFHAWVHGPVTPLLWQACALRRPGLNMLSIVDVDLVDGSIDTIGLAERQRMDSVLEEYAELGMFHLSDLVRSENPWREARGSTTPAARCMDNISHSTMRDFYFNKYRTSLLTQAVSTDTYNP